MYSLFINAIPGVFFPIVFPVYLFMHYSSLHFILYKTCVSFLFSLIFFLFLSIVVHSSSSFVLTCLSYFDFCKNAWVPFTSSLLFFTSLQEEFPFLLFFFPFFIPFFPFSFVITCLSYFIFASWIRRATRYFQGFLCLCCSFLCLLQCVVVNYDAFLLNENCVVIF